MLREIFEKLGVRKTKRGIIANQPCNGTVKACYYKDGNYPEVPTNPDEVINDYWTTAGQLWNHELKYNRIPDRVYDWID